MRITTLICCGFLILFGLGATFYALFGVDLLALVTAGNRYLFRALLSLAGVGALWLLFFLIAFKPFKILS